MSSNKNKDSDLQDKETGIIQIAADTPLGVTVDDYSEVELTKTAKDVLARSLISLKSGLISVTPLICKGPTGCPFISRCPIYMADGANSVYPIMKQCVMELNLARQFYLDYIDEFNLEGKVEESPTLRSQISKLAELDVYEYRVKLILAGVAGDSDGSLLIDQAVAVSKDGGDSSVVEQIAVHPAWQILEKLNKFRMDLLDALGATIKRKVWIDVSLKRSDTENYISKQRELLERIESLENKEM